MSILSLILHILFTINISQGKKHKFLVLNDIHYNPNITSACTYGDCEDLGYYGYDWKNQNTGDSPLALIEQVLNRAAKNKYDAILISGDFIKHNFEIGSIDNVSLEHKN